MPAQLFRLLVVGEIVSAVSFEYDDLHVEYFIDLPNSWSCDPGASNGAFFLLLFL